MEDTQSNFFAGPTWNQAGTDVQQCTVQQAVQKAGLDWLVETAPIVSADHKQTAINRYLMTRRVHDERVLGIVPKKFKPIQNMDAFGMFDKVIGGKAIINTAGMFEGGSKVWMLAKMPDVMEITKDDPIEKYLLLSNSHDGKRPLQMLFTPVRVICENTLSLALGSGKDKLAPSVKIKHDGNAVLKMKESERVMAHAVKYYEKFGSFIDYLSKKQMLEDQIRNIIEIVFPPNAKMQITQKIAHHRLEVRRLFDEGKGHDRLGGTAWTLVNAFSEYADHSLAVNKEKEEFRSEQMRSIWFGGARGLKQRSTNLILKAVA